MHISLLLGHQALGVLDVGNPAGTQGLLLFGSDNLICEIPAARASTIFGSDNHISEIAAVLDVRNPAKSRRKIHLLHTLLELNLQTALFSPFYMKTMEVGFLLSIDPSLQGNSFSLLECWVEYLH